MGHTLTGCGVAVGHTLTGCGVAVGHTLTCCGVALGHTLTGCDEDIEINTDFARLKLPIQSLS